MNARIELLSKQTQHRISPYIDGQFIEHLGGCIYDGIWVGEGSDIPNDGGIRLDTLEAMRKIAPPVVRWPGGQWADNYHWADGIGPRDRRPVRQNLGWNALESNHFGTHEFMRFCELLGPATQKYLCCNLGTGTVEEARSWAEYCNCAKDTTLTRQRAANGHPAPFDVMFWGLGNEANYALDGLMGAAQYALSVRRFAGYVKMFASQAQLPWSKNINDAKTVLALMPGWLEPFFGSIPEGERDSVMCFCDLLAYHFYAGGDATADDPPADKHRKFIASLDGMEANLKLYTEYAVKYTRDYHSVDIAVDEWGLWRKEADITAGLGQPSDMCDALFAAAVLHVFHRFEKVAMANLAQTMNVLHSLVYTQGEKFYCSPSYHVFEMLQGHRGGQVIQTRIDSQPALTLPGGKTRAALSVSATKSDEGILVSLLNLSPDAEMKVDLAIPDAARWSIKQMRRLGGAGLDASNTFDRPTAVTPADLPAPAPADTVSLSLPPASLTTLRLNA
ncbi:MAG: hypothetical protein LLG01_09810 [Planctomycetaceae bacterium]|nr:hypothetical protein [Planctomycetaceae bacterium]